MNITMLDADTLGDDMDFSVFEKFGKLTVYKMTSPDEAKEHIGNAEVVIVNKVKLNKDNIGENVKLICITATGFDNVDTAYCAERGIGVCNICGYSTDSVAQLTAAFALSLIMHLPVSDKYVKDGSYTRSGVHNCLTPVFHEISGMTWGIVGMGAIGRKTAQIAKALGANVIAYNRTVRDDFEYTDIDDLCRRSDIISIHTPLNEGTYKLINRERIALMKKNAIVINVARGAVVDEEALSDAILEERIGGIGIDVFSVEPMQSDSPYNRILDKDNVIFTPHMAWGTYEARKRCINEVAENISDFLNGGTRNRVV